MCKVKNKNTRTTQFRTTKFNTFLFPAANIAYTGKRWNKQEHGREMSDFLSRYRKVHQNYFRHFWQSLMKSGIRWVWYCLQIWLRIFRNLIGETRLYSSSKSQTIVENRNEWIRINLFKSRVKWGNNAWSRLTLITRDSY